MWAMWAMWAAKNWSKKADQHFLTVILTARRRPGGGGPGGWNDVMLLRHVLRKTTIIIWLCIKDSWNAGWFNGFIIFLSICTPAQFEWSRAGLKLNILDHQTGELIFSRATVDTNHNLNPNLEWRPQQVDHGRSVGTSRVKGQCPFGSELILSRAILTMTPRPLA